jgi:hypothetical protein
MYKLVKTGNGYNINIVGTNIHIPMNPDNTDYQAYLKWVSEGNTPEPADE